MMYQIQEILYKSNLIEMKLKSNSANLLNNSMNIWNLREDERKLTIPQGHFNAVVLLSSEVVSDEIIVD